MTNKQVNEVLNDYFSELLGGAEDNNKASEQKNDTLAVASVEKKGTSKELIKQDRHKNPSDDTLKNDRANKVEQRPEEGALKPRTNLTKKPITTVGKVKKQRQANVPQASYSPTQQKISEAQSITNASGYSEHKEKLEKMLQQVSALNTINVDSPEVSIQARVETESKLETSSERKGLEERIEGTVTQPLNDITTSVSSRVSTDKVLIDTTEATAISHSQPLLEQSLQSQWNENGRPEWAQNPFDILLVEVNGLQLAVPLVALGQIQEIEEEITPLFGQSEWFMGLQKTPTGNVKVVNTAKFIMTESYKDQHNYKFVISINGLQWGLAVDNINQPITINPEQIRWRAKRESRPWMAGMVKDHMCVLLDIPKVGEILQGQDKNRAD